MTVPLPYPGQCPRSKGTRCLMLRTNCKKTRPVLHRIAAAAPPLQARQRTWPGGCCAHQPQVTVPHRPECPAAQRPQLFTLNPPCAAQYTTAWNTTYSGPLPEVPSRQSKALTKAHEEKK
ncbi:hypothetical protein NDU88_005567 [Pleurodeles waltl]|uniref:Uncharacterized protein n=1 Tax=Pleurodeles waltl TaxID=8319 RepID=A0AAV7L4T6_PLEWA|nr:hypothetical protein NDU88_005567 [Pleurodeles waltl]